LSRRWLSPLTPLYAAGLAARNAAYARGWLRPEPLQWPVASIGNLSVGGAGKTPLTIRLAGLLTAQGIAVDVLSRGYGRSSMATEGVDPAGDAQRYGDEPLLIARRAGVPVYVGASRYQAGLLAETQAVSAPQPGILHAVHLLDDGFQHRQLHRDADIVLLHRSDFSETLLPSGRLREPLAALRRADFVVLREEDADFEPELSRLDLAAPIWWMRRVLELPPGASPAQRVVAFCGIARPGEFFAALGDRGQMLAGQVSFPDHHRYTGQDAKRLAQICKETRAEAFLTSEKDAVKLDATLLAELERAAPVRVVRLVLSLRDEERIVAQLLARLASSNLSAPTR
jgi:tetraacyldisaccharide 4'-kinase